ncbi:MAG: hypothetical protein ACLS89_00670, partial [Collinsella sp.]
MGLLRLRAEEPQQGRRGPDAYGDDNGQGRGRLHRLLRQADPVRRPPGETVHDGFQAGTGTAPATVEFKANEPSWVDSQTLDEDVFTVSNTAEVPDSYGGVSYTGELTAYYDLDKKQYGQVAVSVIARDASGAINYGNTTFVDAPSK